MRFRWSCCRKAVLAWLWTPPAAEFNAGSLSMTPAILSGGGAGGASGSGFAHFRRRRVGRLPGVSALRLPERQSFLGWTAAIYYGGDKTSGEVVGCARREVGLAGDARPVWRGRHAPASELAPLAPTAKGSAAKLAGVVYDDGIAIVFRPAAGAAGGGEQTSTRNIGGGVRDVTIHTTSRGSSKRTREYKILGG